MAWPGGAPLGIGMDAMEGEWHTSGFKSPAPTHGWARSGEAWLGQARQVFWLGVCGGRLAATWVRGPGVHAGLGQARFGKAWQWPVMARHGWVWRGAFWHGTARRGEAWVTKDGRHIPAFKSPASARGEVWPG
jgi:hypothetical protein